MAGVMFDETSAHTWIALCFSAAFALTGLVHLAGPDFLKRAYCQSQYPRRFYRNAGLWMLLAATLLAVPGARLAGALLGGFLIFATTVLMLERRRYLALVAAVPLLAALLPVVFAAVQAL